MKRFCTLFVFTMVFGATKAPAIPSIRECATMSMAFAKDKVDKAKPYASDLWNTWGGRFFLAPPHVDPNRLPWGLGFIYRSKPLSDLDFFDRWNPRTWTPLTRYMTPWGVYELRPFAGLYHLGVRLPFWATTRFTGLAVDGVRSILPSRPKAIGHGIAFMEARTPEAILKSVRYLARKFPTLPLPNSSTLREPSIWVYGGVATAIADALFDDQLRRKKIRDLKRNKKKFENLIEYDWRYRDIKEARDIVKWEDRVSRWEALLASLAKKEQYEEYYKYLETDFENEAPEDRRKRVLLFPIMHELADFVARGVQEKEGYIVPNPGPLSDTQIDKLIEIENNRITMHQLARMWVNEPGKLAEILSQNVNAASRISELNDSAFIKWLFGKNEEGILSDEELVFRIQEDIEWTTKFERWKAIGVVRLKVDEAGEPTPEPLQPLHIQEATAFELGRKEKLLGSR